MSRQTIDLSQESEITWASPKGLSVDDELNLYLVANGLKPAAMIDLDPFYSEDYRIEDRGNGIYVIHGESDIRPRLEDVLQLKTILDDIGIDYKEMGSEERMTMNNMGKELVHEHLPFYIGADQEGLDRLLAAQSDEEIGTALGYSEEAVRLFQEVIEGERRDGAYCQVSIAKAKQAGLELPLWLAYISHVPEKLDLINDDVSYSSKELGKKYMEFIRTNCPELANRVEQRFINMRRPDRWELQPNGSYIQCFEPYHKGEAEPN